MPHVAPAKEQRRHPRAQLQLPVRIRWRGPLGSLVEFTEALDVSREGLLVTRQQETRKGSRVWVTVPFDGAGANTVQPETPARVVRVQSTASGANLVALHFENPRRNASQPPESERRRNMRVSFGLPILVRPANSPWPEETMTQDISQGGARFETTRSYSVGDVLLLQIQSDAWKGPREVPGRVVRLEPALDSGVASQAEGDGDAISRLASVAIQWESSLSFT
jgi:PilZ domain